MFFAPSITHLRHLPVLMLLALLAFPTMQVRAQGADAAPGQQRQFFVDAWDAARRGDRQTFDGLRPQLEGYLLYPYWRYEHYRFHRSRVAPQEMADFLHGHADWAFARGLETAWLKTLGEQRRWESLLRYGEGSADTEVRCYHARARLATGHLEGLLPEARALWTVGRSQPDACDPVFAWLIENGGITPEVAWERIRLAFQGGNARFTLYLARFLPPGDRAWLERWQKLNAGWYRDLEHARGWPDNSVTRMITLVSLERLAHHDARLAMRAFRRLDGHFDWDPERRGRVMREIALMAAVDLEPEGKGFIDSVPPAYRDDQLLQWKARLALSMKDWQGVLEAVGEMTAATVQEDRWKYWSAQARMALGDRAAAEEELRELAASSGYYGFMAADHTGLPYTICPLPVSVDTAKVEALRARADFARALELRHVGLENWALSEWNLATRNLPPDELRAAAALAHAEEWHDRVIFALGANGDLRHYEWRFPLLWEEPVMVEAARSGLDPAWVFGVMRSESAMTETARSSAGALGLMQVTHDTARRISRKHGLEYARSSELLQGKRNIRFGTVYLREMLDRFGQNMVLAAGAYNAGPKAVERWLGTRPISEAAVWIETLPYYETRDYIPRVLAFSTIYDWRLGNPVPRISARMPQLDSEPASTYETTQVVCRPPPPGLEVAGP